MAKDGTARGGQRVGSGRKNNALADKITTGRLRNATVLPEPPEMEGLDMPPVREYKIMAFMISAVYSAIAGVLYAHMTGYVSPDSFTGNESNFILWAAIIGGLGTQMGPILGGFIMIVFPEALRALGTWRLIIFGVILMLVIIYYPQGLVPFLQEMKKKIAAKFEKRTGKEGK